MMTKFEMISDCKCLCNVQMQSVNLGVGSSQIKALILTLAQTLRHSGTLGEGYII